MLQLSFVNKLEDNDVKVIRYTENNAYDVLKSSEIDALINFESGIPKITLEGSDPSKSQAVIKLTQNATFRINSNCKTRYNLFIWL